MSVLIPLLQPRVYSSKSGPECVVLTRLMSSRPHWLSRSTRCAARTHAPRQLRVLQGGEWELLLWEINALGTPWGPSGQDCVRPWQGSKVWSLVEELRSCKLHGMARKTSKNQQSKTKHKTPKN